MRPMANPIHLTKFMRGVASWNKWVEQNPDEELDLSGERFLPANLERVNLAFADLRGSIFDEANLRNAELTGAKLARARFAGTCLQGARLFESDLSDAVLFQTDLRQADLRATTLRRADFFQADLNGADLCAADMEGAKLSGVKNLVLNQTKIRGALFAARADDPWSVLRREYSGSRLIFNLLFLVFFFFPYFLKTLFWVAVNRAQLYTESFVIGSVDIVIDTERVLNVSKCFSSQCADLSVWALILGFDRGWMFLALSLLLITYNLLKAAMTWSVSSMREEEERTGSSPAWDGAPLLSTYRPLHVLHKWVVQPLFWVAVCVFLCNAFDWLGRTVWVPSP